MLENLKSTWNTMVQKVKENKETVIRVGAVVLGAAVGMIVAGIVNNSNEEFVGDPDLELDLIDEELDALEDEDDEEVEEVEE